MLPFFPLSQTINVTFSFLSFFFIPQRAENVTVFLLRNRLKVWLFHGLFCKRIKMWHFSIYRKRMKMWHFPSYFANGWKSSFCCCCCCIFQERLKTWHLFIFRKRLIKPYFFHISRMAETVTFFSKTFKMFHNFSMFCKRLKKKLFSIFR